jgi:hypothetical protein
MIALQSTPERGASLPTEERNTEVPKDKDIVEDDEDLEIEEEAEEELLSAKAVAKMLDTDPRTFRKFMRSITEKEEQPGQGGRYGIDPEDVPSLQKQFAKWSKPSKNGKKEFSIKVEDDEVVDLTDEDLVDDADSSDLLDEIEVIED